MEQSKKHPKKHFKSERLKKLESELNDLEQWLKLELVPKRDIDKHKDEIKAVLSKIEEEKERLQFLREGGETEDYVAPKKSQPRAGYTEMPSIPDVTATENQISRYHESTFSRGRDEMTNELSTSNEKTSRSEITALGDEEEKTVFEDEESYFSEKNRWKRGRDIIDPDADEW